MSIFGTLTNHDPSALVNLGYAALIRANIDAAMPLAVKP